MTTFQDFKWFLDEMGFPDAEPTSTFYDLGIDSLEMVQLVMDMEERFHIEIPDDDLALLGNVQNALDYINSHN